MTALNTSIKELIELQKSSGKAEALDLIGKSVVVQQSSLLLSGGMPVDLAYSLSEDADVTINIYNGGDEPVRTIEVGDQLAGEHSLTWDGLNDEGIRMPDGEYTYSVSGFDSSGNEVVASEIISGIVDGLVFGDEPYISIGGIRVPLTAVTEVLLDTPES
jgi:flagellar basal-body rod modification protein FlgD